MLWKYFITNIVPILYVLGVFYAVVIQANRIRNLKADLKTSRGLLEDLEKKVNISLLVIEKASKAKEETLEIEQKKMVEGLMAKFDEDKTQMGKIATTMMGDYTQLLIALFRPLADTWFLENSVNMLPEGIVKDVMKRLRERIKEINKEQGISDPMIGLLVGHLVSKPGAPKTE